MAVTIREIRADDLDAVVRAVEQAGGQVDRSRVEHRMSLVACDDASDREAAGVVLCVRGEQGGVVLHVAFPTAEPDAELVSELVSKALTKARCAAVHACRVLMHGELPAACDPLSTGNNWYERFAREHVA